MILTEKHIIKRKSKTEELFQKIDGYCYSAKNLRNATNYLITQCSRISYKLKQGEILDSWEKKLIYDINCGISAYNKASNKSLKYIDDNNGFISDAYFLSYHLKGTKEYKVMPFATCSQIVIQNICRDWKAYYQGLKAYNKNPSSMLGRPHKPSYYDKGTDRGWLLYNGVIEALKEYCEEMGCNVGEVIWKVKSNPNKDTLRTIKAQTFEEWEDKFNKLKIKWEI